MCLLLFAFHIYAYEMIVFFFSFQNKRIENIHQDGAGTEDPHCGAKCNKNDAV